MAKQNFIASWQRFAQEMPDLALAIKFILIVLICYGVYVISRGYLLRWLQFLLKMSHSQWVDFFLAENPFRKIALLIPLILFYHGSAFLEPLTSTFENLSLIIIGWILIILSEDILDTILKVYQTYEISKIRPIKGYIQVIKILLYLAGMVLSVSLLLNKTPLYLLSGLGAVAALLLLIFKDTILALVASLQLQSNDMIKLDDWIDMPKYNADGEVVEIALHTVKVQNWDKSITTIPTQKLIEDSFRNWRGMLESGGRRICRTVLIDVQSVRFCDSEMTEAFSKIQLLKTYIQEKQIEIDRYNQEHGIDLSSSVNGRRMTNLGTFRAYLLAYLRHHPGIHKDLTLIVRQMEATSQGIPMQIYCFTSTTKWFDYESIQSDIFDHIFSVLPQFSLVAYQAPSGRDFQK